MRAAEICKLRPFTITENFGAAPTTIGVVSSLELLVSSRTAEELDSAVSLKDDEEETFDELDSSLRELEELVAISC